MKKIFFLLAIFASIYAGAQTADEIVQNYAKAMGGLDAFNKVQSAKLTGSLLIQGNEFPITIQIVNGKSYRLDADMNGMAVIQSFDKGKGWKINPFAGSDTATDMNASELLDTKSQSFLATQLMDYKSRGHAVSFEGKDTIEGVEVYKLKLTSKDDGRVTIYCIDTKTNLPLKVSSSRELQGKSMMIDSYYSDFKDIEGLKFSATRIQKLDNQILQELHLDKIELNVPIDEKIFAKP